MDIKLIILQFLFEVPPKSVIRGEEMIVTKFKIDWAQAIRATFDPKFEQFNDFTLLMRFEKQLLTINLSYDKMQIWL